VKNFKEEIQKFLWMLQSNKNFSLARFGDGEMIAMRGECISSGYGEWSTNGFDDRYDLARNLLHKSFTYKDPNYYVGIVCPCCQGYNNFNNMKKLSDQSDENLTYANIFVNSNYQYFINNYIELFKKRNIILVANEKSKVNNLPFSGEAFIPVKYNAWVENINLVDELKNWKTENKLYLFACGPLGKILAQQLWEVNKNNTYLDIGSTLHPWLQSDLNIRGYYILDHSDNKKICYWG